MSPCRPMSAVSCCVQYNPFMVQATESSSGDSGRGAEGGLTAVLPSGPPRSRLVFCPADTVLLCPLAVTTEAPLKTLTSMVPFVVALRLASPISRISVPFTLNRIPAPSGMDIVRPSNGTWSQSICPSVLEK